MVKHGQRQVDFVALQAVFRALLVASGEDPERDGLRDTPTRAAKAWMEQLGVGRPATAAEVLRTTGGDLGFVEEASHDGMVVQPGLPFASMCEHHIMPFYGTADVGYLPGHEFKRVVGLSKLGKLVQWCSHGLQLQERITHAIASELLHTIRARGVGVRLVAQHTCMRCRGMRADVPTVTEVLLGDFRKHDVRAEFWELCRAGATNRT